MTMASLLKEAGIHRKDYPVEVDMSHQIRGIQAKLKHYMWKANRFPAATNQGFKARFETVRLGKELRRLTVQKFRGDK